MDAPPRSRATAATVAWAAVLEPHFAPQRLPYQPGVFALRQQQLPPQPDSGPQQHWRPGVGSTSGAACTHRTRFSSNLAVHFAVPLMTLASLHRICLSSNASDKPIMRQFGAPDQLVPGKMCVFEHSGRRPARSVEPR